MYQKYFINKKAVLFDLDGTILDSEELWETSMKKILTNIGEDRIDLNDTKNMYLPDRWKILLNFNGIKPPVPISELVVNTQKEFLKQFYESNLDFREGFWNLAYELKQKRNLKLGLITNTQKEIAAQIIKHLEAAELFDIVIGGDEVKKPKPDPEIYNTAAAKLQLSTKQILVFEDSPVGVEACVRAKMQVIVIWNGKEATINYNSKAKEFLPDFSTITAENMNRSFLDIITEATKEYSEKH